MTTAVKIVENINVYTDQDGTLRATAEVNSEQVQEILDQHPEVTDVMVVAIMGPSRKGKSFLMNLFAIYLQQLASFNSGERWLESTDVIEGLTWKQSRSAGTEGIYLWKKAFVLPGKKVKVLLMDCQGCQDKDKVGQSGTIDAITNAIGIRTSTVHLYNIVDTKPNINDIQALNNMIYYMEARERGRDLTILHRDWDADDRLGLLRRTPELDNERAIMEKFGGDAGNIASYRLPNPGKKIRGASQEDRNTVAALYKEGPEPKRFLDQVTELCTCLFSSLDQSRVIASQQFIEAVNNVGQRFGVNFTPLHFAPSSERLRLGIATKRIEEMTEKYRGKLEGMDIENMSARYELESALDGIRRNARSEFQQLKLELNVTADDATLTDELRYGEKSLEKMLSRLSDVKLIKFQQANEGESVLEIGLSALSAGVGWVRDFLRDGWWSAISGFLLRNVPGGQFFYNLYNASGDATSYVPFAFMVLLISMQGFFLGLLFFVSFLYCLYLAYHQGLQSQNRQNEHSGRQPAAEPPLR